MASLSSSACCVKASLHSGERRGTLHKVHYAGIAAYETGDKTSKRALVIGIDIFGYDFLNTNLVADHFAEKGYYVLVPDILLGDPYDTANFTMESLQKWRVNHGNDVTCAKWHEYLVELKKNIASDAELYGVAYCFGAPCIFSELKKDGLLKAGAVAHPTGVSIEAVEAVEKPILISAAQHDPVFPPELRHKTEEALLAKNAVYQIDLFSQVEHGFAIKGDITKPEVKYAKEKCFTDVVCWFSRF